MYINNNIFNFKNKKLLLILNKIYGVDIKQIKYIFNNLGLNLNFSINNLTPQILKQINEFLTKNYLINKDLQYKITNNKKAKNLLNTYKGFRLSLNLPIHGQNTHSNGKTAKKNKIKYINYAKLMPSIEFKCTRNRTPSRSIKSR